MKLTDWPLPELMTTKISIQEWALQAVRELTNSESPTLDVQVLMAFALKQRREWLVIHNEDPLTQEQVDSLDTYLKRLQNGEPLAYITGKRSFYGLDFMITPAVLVPRPETELLVEEALNWLEANPNRRKGVDVGTGSGIIAISLADRFTDLRMTAIDISSEALTLAEENARIHALQDRIQFIQNDLLKGIDDRFDLIAANLPYIPTDTLKNLDVIHHEPRQALDGGSDGLLLINQLLEQSVQRIYPNGLILLEIEATQGQKATAAAKKYFPEAKIDCLNDYADLPRLVKIQA
jgi:release factor glutamine methyltransferase